MGTVSKQIKLYWFFLFFLQHRQTNTQTHTRSMIFTYSPVMAVAMAAIVIAIVVGMILVRRGVIWHTDKNAPTVYLSSILRPLPSPQTSTTVLSQLPIFVINLQGTEIGEKRWKLMQQTPFRDQLIRVPAVYGKTYDFSYTIDNNILRDVWDYGKWKQRPRSQWISITPSEMGCSLSHHNVWKRIVQNRIPISMILEDDCAVIHPQFTANFNRLIQAVPNDWDVFLLNFWLHRGDDGKHVNEDFTRVNHFVLMSAYVVNERGATKLLQCLPIDKPLDSWLSDKADVIHIYRHNMMHPKTLKSTLIRTVGAKIGGNSIFHTNNWWGANTIVRHSCRPQREPKSR